MVNLNEPLSCARLCLLRASCYLNCTLCIIDHKLKPIWMLMLLIINSKQFHVYLPGWIHKCSRRRWNCKL